MLFPTIEFLIFFLLVYSLFWLVRSWNWGAKFFLVIASYAFYAYWDWRFTILLFSSSLINYIIGLWVDYSRRSFKSKPSHPKIILGIGIAINVMILGFFKYTTFILLSTKQLFFFLGLQIPLPVIQVVLPVGISFFTFQAMSYIIDVYRRDISPVKSFFDLLLFISFFPQLVAGPIVRAKQFLPQLEVFSRDVNLDVTNSLKRIIGGLFKKVIVANYLAELIVDPLFASPGNFQGIEILIGVYAYAIQIFCDFSAYSDIAIGVAKLFGFSFPENFDRPYRARSVQDFWKRWHISLSSWLRDYLYIPLGGSRKGEGRKYFNLMLTMILGGLWHGAAFNFLLWGFIQGIFLAGNHGIKKLYSRRALEPVEFKEEADGVRSRRILFKRGLINFFKVFSTFHLICFAWIFFRSPDLETVELLLQRMFLPMGSVLNLSPMVFLLLFIGFLIQYIPRSSFNRLWIKIDALPWPVKTVLLSGSMLVIFEFAPLGVAPFIYFQF